MTSFVIVFEMSGQHQMLVRDAGVGFAFMIAGRSMSAPYKALASV